MAQTIPHRQAELQALLEQAAWYRALSLSERVDSLLTATSQATNGLADLALGQRRLEKWKQQSAFAKETDFAERLAMDHVSSEEDLIYLLGETDEALQARTLTSPVWLSRLREAFSNASLTERFVEHTTLLAQPLSAFLSPILPLLAQGYQDLLTGIEALAQHYPSSPLQPLVSTHNGQDLPLSVEILAASVIRSGVLPKRIYGNADAAGIDISDLGGRGGQLTPQPVAMWEAMNTDQMHLKRERIAITEQQNRPSLAGQTVNMLDYMDEVIIGFTSMYHLLVRHRVELLSRFLPSLAQDEIRIILRPTRTYGQFLHEGQHPTLLHNVLDRERFLDRIWGARQLGRQVIRAERLDMFINDIPLFTTSADAQYLQTSQSERIADFFRASGLETARQKMQQLDETDLARQIWIIRASFASILMGEAQSSWKATCLQSSDTLLTQDRTSTTSVGWYTAEPREASRRFTHHWCI